VSDDTTVGAGGVGGTEASPPEQPSRPEASAPEAATAQQAPSSPKPRTAQKRTAKKPRTDTRARATTKTRTATKTGTATKTASTDAGTGRTAAPGTKKSAKRSGKKSGTKTPGSSSGTEGASSRKAASATSRTSASGRAPATRRSAPRGAFAAGAARASGERRRRSGTPLVPSEPVEVTAARRIALIEGAPLDDRSSTTTATSRQSDAAGSGQRPQTSPEAHPEPPQSAPGDAPAAPSPQPAEASADVAPTGRRRPTRASMRSRRTAGGEPTRLHAVPSVGDPDSHVPAGDPMSSDSGDAMLGDLLTDTDSDVAPDALGREPSLTSGLQSRAGRLVGAVLEAAEFSSEARPGPAELVDLAVNVLRAAATSAGLPAEEVERQVASALAYLRRRLTGDYIVDEFGFDEDYTVNVHLPLLRPFYQKWFRVEVRGIENIPSVGGALVVGNHSGTIAMDSLMTQVAVYDEHPDHRHLRMLGADLVFQTPFVGTMARRSGTTLAANTDAERLLRGGALVGVWPEGFKGVGKPFSERYKLQRFGRGGFVSAALRAGVPIVPVSIVGAEEIYPILGNMPTVARLLGLPYAPITPTFPLLGPLGMVPLPSKWLIEFGPPIDTSSLGPDAADDPMLVFDLTDQVRETIQQTLYSLLMQRKSVFL
jgi:1-acyl-sn-glycerol-3-phosphate acyltransferase